MSRRDRRHPARLSPIFEEPHFSRELLLDQYPGAEVALSLQKLRYGYSGDCIRVRRSSDDAEQHIGFDGGSVDEQELINFANGGNLYVPKKFDQADATLEPGKQSTLADQPQIVSGGSVVKPDSRVAVRISGGDHLKLSSLPSGDLKTILMWVRFDNNVDQEGNSSALLASPGANVPIMVTGGVSTNLSNETLAILDSNANGPAITDPLSAGWHHIGVRWDGSDYAFVVDGTERSRIFRGSNRSIISMSNFEFGYRTSNDDIALEGHFQTIALFSESLSVSDIQSHYNATK